MNIIIPSSTYKYVKFCANFFSQPKNILKQISGIEPALFLLLPIIDWQTLTIKPKRAAKILDHFKKVKPNKIPLSNGRPGIRLHGLIEFGFKYNQVNYFSQIKIGASLLAEQIKLAAKLALVAGVDDRLYPSIITIHLGRVFDKPEVEIKKVIEVFNQISPLAKENRVIINIETMRGIEKGKYELGSDLEDLAKIFSGLEDKENFGITFDLAHSLIYYQGDYQKIKDTLVKQNLLPLINYLHLVAPHRNYKIQPLARTKRGGFFLWELAANLLTYQPDSHAGFKTFFRHRPEEREQFLDLIDFLIKNSKVSEEKFNVINLEVGMNVWGTSKGAAIGDLGYTLEVVGKIIKNKNSKF